MSYPDTNLSGGTQDPAFGGGTPNRFGTKARKFIDAVLQEVERQIILHVWRPFRAQKVRLSQSGLPGDVIVENLNGAEIDYTLTCVKNVTYDPDTTPRRGVLLEGASAGGTAWMIYDGTGIPPQVHGLAPGTVDYVRFNETTGRLERASGSTSNVIGWINTKGYASLFPKLPGTD